MTNPFDQGGYQVRLEWGAAGLARLAPADILVLVDVLGPGAAPLAALEAEPTATVSAAALPGGVPDGAAHPGGEVTVLWGNLRNATAVARACLAEQHARGGRTSIAVIPALGVGASAEASQTSTRFAVENLLAAGAIVGALSALGTDHTSPEAAAACEAFHGLRRAVGHLVTASGTARAFDHTPDAAPPLPPTDAARVDATTLVPVLRGGAIVALDTEGS